MKCQRQPTFLKDKPTPICDLWEVQLTPKMWRFIQQLARKRRTTYSSISRFCLFRLAEPQTLRLFPLLRKIAAENKKTVSCSPQLHRHIICLYGEDVKLLKLAAMQLNLTVSAFIRLALWLYLPRLLSQPNSKYHIRTEVFLALSIKRWMSVQIGSLNILRNPVIRRFTFASFPPWFWW